MKANWTIRRSDCRRRDKLVQDYLLWAPIMSVDRRLSGELWHEWYEYLPQR